jgi:hypothetical protein
VSHPDSIFLSAFHTQAHNDKFHISVRVILINALALFYSSMTIAETCRVLHMVIFMASKHCHNFINVGIFRICSKTGKVHSCALIVYFSL